MCCTSPIMIAVPISPEQAPSAYRPTVHGATKRQQDRACCQHTARHARHLLTETRSPYLAGFAASNRAALLNVANEAIGCRRGASSCSRGAGWRRGAWCWRDRAAGGLRRVPVVHAGLRARLALQYRAPLGCAISVCLHAWCHHVFDIQLPPVLDPLDLVTAMHLFSGASAVP